MMSHPITFMVDPTINMREWSTIHRALRIPKNYSKPL